MNSNLVYAASGSQRMEADAISKNGQRPKNHKSRVKYLLIAAFALTAVFAACGGGEVSFDGVYVGKDVTCTISGNTYEWDFGDGMTSGGTFTLDVQHQGKGISRGLMRVVDRRSGESEWKYELKGNQLTLGKDVLIKQATPQETSNNRSLFGSSRGSSGTITITTVERNMEFELHTEDDSSVTIDWGDGTIETKDFLMFWHQYKEEPAVHTITITGKNITGFQCDSKVLTNLDVSKCATLQLLWCRMNDLTNLDLSKNTALTDLDCRGNKLKTLDLSKNTALVDLECRHNELTNLDVSKCVALMRLTCTVNKLTSLDVSKCTNLIELFCLSNELTGSALNALFRTLHSKDAGFKKEIYINGNPGTDDCDQSIATKKGWQVKLAY